MPVIGTLCLIAVVESVFLAWVLPLVVLYLALMRYPRRRRATCSGSRRRSLADLLAVLETWGSRRSARSARRRA